MARLRVLSYNVHGLRNRRGRRDPAGIRALLDAHDIDIAIFQEMETRASRGGAVDDIKAVAGDTRPYHLPGLALHDNAGHESAGWYGNLIVSRYPILRGMVHDLETSARREPRNAVDALVDTPIGKWRIIGTHLSLAGRERLAEVRNLLRLIDRVEEVEKNPLLLMGDFNEWLYRAKLLLHINSIMTPVKLGPSFPSFFPFLRLDRCWVDKYEGAYSARILKTRQAAALSDHLPMLIEFA